MTSVAPQPAYVIVLSENLEMQWPALTADADAFVQSGDLPDELLAAIRQARSRRRGLGDDDSMMTEGK